jgi:hypothetical protein
MESKIDIQSVRDAQDSKFLAVLVFDTKRGQFRFIDNDSYISCSVADLVPALAAAKDLKNVCLLGSLTLLNNAGLSAEMLREKGAITDLQSFVSMANAAVRGEYKRSDRPTFKVIGKAINTILKQWKSGLLAQCDHLLNQELNARAINIMTNDWYQLHSHTNVELVDILHKRIARHVKDETSAYLGALTIRQNEENSDDSEVDAHALIIGKVNYQHKLIDDARTLYRSEVETQMHSDFFNGSNSTTELNKVIKSNRDTHVLKRFQAGELSRILSQKLDSDLSDRILSAIRIDEMSFSRESPELSKWICEEAHSKQKGMAVDRMNGFNAIVVAELIVNFKKGKINSDLKRELVSYLMPLVEELKLESDDEEKAVVLESVDSIVSNPAQLVDSARAQFIETVSCVIRSSVDVSVKLSEDQAGKTLIGSFCGEILTHLNCSRAPENFNDPDQISALFNKDEVSLSALMEARIKMGPGLFNQAKVTDGAAKPVVADFSNKSGPSGPSK